MVVEAHGLPIGVDLGAANQNDLTLVEPVLKNALRGLKKPHHLLADAEYSSRPLAEQLKRQYHIIFTAPPRRHYVNFFHDGRHLRRGKRRWKVERCFSWLRGKRRIETRWERYPENYLGLVRLACIDLLRHRLAI